MAKKKTSRKKDRQKAAQPEPVKAAPAPMPPSALTDRETRKKVLNVVGQVVVVALIMFLMVWGRAYYSQQKFYFEGEAALKVKNYKDAVTGYEWAVRMYTPFSGKVSDACKKLWYIGNEYEKRGQLDWALITYRSLRSSIYAIESLYAPYAEWIPKTDEKIKKILAIEKRREARKVSLQQKKK